MNENVTLEVEEPNSVVEDVSSIAESSVSSRKVEPIIYESAYTIDGISGYRLMDLEILSNVIKGLKCPNTDYCDEGELMFSENEWMNEHIFQQHNSLQNEWMNIYFNNITVYKMNEWTYISTT